MGTREVSDGSSQNASSVLSVLVWVASASANTRV